MKYDHNKRVNLILLGKEVRVNRSGISVIIKQDCCTNINGFRLFKARHGSRKARKQQQARHLLSSQSNFACDGIIEILRS